MAAPSLKTGSARPSPAPGRGAGRARRVQFGLGMLAVLCVLAAWSWGVLGFLERLTLDARAQLFGLFAPEPSDRIVVIAIDQPALDNVQRWPWDRQRIAEVIAELTRAGAGVIALDILLNDPQPPRLVRLTDEGGEDHADAPGPDAGVPARFIHDDRLLAEAIRAHARVIVAAGFQFQTGEREEVGGSAGIFRVDPARVLALLEAEPALVEAPEDEAFRRLAPALLPPGTIATRGAAIDAVRRATGAAWSLLRAADRSALPITDRTPGRWPSSPRPTPSVPVIADAAARIANVTFDSFDPDFHVRRVPLLVESAGRLWPNLGLSAALLLMEREVSSLRIEDGAVVVPGGVRLPVRSGQGSSGRQDGLFFVTWPRSTVGRPRSLSGWEWQFYDRRADVPGEFPIGFVYEPAQLRRRLAENLASLRQIVRGVYARSTISAVTAEQRAALLESIDAMRQALEPGPSGEATDDYRAGLERLRPLIGAAEARLRETLQFMLDGVDRSDLSAEDLQPIEAMERALVTVPALLTELENGPRRIDEARRRIRERVEGRLCFVGWTATGAIADFVPSSIAAKTPGVHVHAAVANAVLTGLVRRPAPAWADALLLLALGVGATLVGVRAGVVAGPLIVAAMILAWFLVVGLLAWDLGRVIVSFEGPATAAGAGLLVVYVHRLLVEQRGRKRTEERFKSYVSPEVVEILVNNPELDSMRPMRKELTILFTDLAGFTSTAERLGSARTAEVLARYLGTMTQTIQERSATLDKYIGDAIVAFWGAPIDNPAHARDACLAVNDMLRRLDAMNASGEFHDAGGLFMRVGLASGEVMVGDFGNPPRNSSYTVLGDTANLASRLEGANKAFGTRALVSGRVRELAERQGGLPPGFLWRRIGRVRVKGKAEPIDLFELLGDLRPRGDRTLDWIAATEALVAAFTDHRLDDAELAAARLQSEFDDPLLAGIYRRAIQQARTGLFDGCITLDEK
jgi:class 3 adenylate cyclase/CHASE2 domain-containing sensor protein